MIHLVNKCRSFFVVVVFGVFFDRRLGVNALAEVKVSLWLAVLVQLLVGVILCMRRSLNCQGVCRPPMIQS